MAESSSAVLKGFFTAPGKVHIRLLKHGVLENISKGSLQYSHVSRMNFKSMFSSRTFPKMVLYSTINDLELII